MYLIFYRMVAILPFKGHDYRFFGSQVLLVFFLVSNAIHLAMFLGYGINHMRQGMVELDYICELVPLIGVSAKLWLLLVQRAKCNELVQECHKLWDNCNDDERTVVRYFEQKLRKLFKFLLSTCVLLNVFYSYTAITMKLPPEEPNGTERRILPYRWFVDEVKTSPAYEGIFALQVVLLNNAGVIVMAIETAAPFLIMMSCGYLKVLQLRFLEISVKYRNFVRGRDEEAVYRELLSCAKFHQRILDTLFGVQKLTRTLFLIQLLCTIYNLSLVGVKLAGTDPDKYKFVPTFFLCFVQLFICQWTPDYLLQESEAVSTAAYFTYLAASSSHRTTKLLLTVIQRAQHPVEISAGGFLKLSLQTFKSMLTSSLSFFTVLRRFNS